MKKKKLKKQLKIWKKSYRDAIKIIKEKNDQINTLVFEPESDNANIIRYGRTFNRELNELVMFGMRNMSVDEVSNGRGILDMIEYPNTPTGTIEINVAGMDTNQWVSTSAIPKKV
jgi:hypothetical protein